MMALADGETLQLETDEFNVEFGVGQSLLNRGLALVDDARGNAGLGLGEFQVTSKIDTIVTARDLPHGQRRYDLEVTVHTGIEDVYDFDFGDFKADTPVRLEARGLAAPFEIGGSWVHSGTGYVIVDGDGRVLSREIDLELMDE